MLRHACISAALLLALGTAAHAQADAAVNYEGCPEVATPGDPHELPIRKYQRLLDCAKQALMEAKMRLNQLSDVELDDFAQSLLDANQGLKSQLNLKNDRIKQLETEGATKDRTIAELRDEVRELNSRVEALEKEEVRLHGVIDGQRASLDDALKRNGGLDDQVRDYKEQVDRLTTQIAVLERELDDARRLITALSCHVDRLSTQRGPFYNELKLALGNDQRIQIVDDTLVTPLDILFKVGSAELSAEGRQRIDAVADLMRDRTFPGDPDWVLQVNGHTDVQQYRRTTRFPKNNWELSVARALAVVMRLQEHGMPGDRVAAAGYSEFRPIDKAKTQEAYAVNRRVEFKLVEYGRQAGKDCPPLPEESAQLEEEEEG